MVEFKCDNRDGIPKLLEINGRFWGSLQLAVDAGIDFPYLLYRLAVDGDVEPEFTYEEGVCVRWWLGDLDWLLLRLREGGESTAWLGAIREFMRSSGNSMRAEVFRWDDPWPAFEELSQYVRDIARGAVRRLHRGVDHE
jgi:predicted ATP-grasp superfamily ATP-dependent carboligase